MIFKRVNHRNTKAVKDPAGEVSEEAYSFSSIAPQIIYTFTNAENTLDFSTGGKIDFLFTGEGVSALFGATLGAGLSSDLNKWAIRPEVGVLSLGGVGYLSYGVGLQVMIPKRDKSGKR